MIPNSPISRLRYVIKQYDGTKNQRILPDVIIASLYAFGRDNQARILAADPKEPMFIVWDGTYDSEYGPMPADERAGHLETLEHVLGQILPPTHEWDFIVPWVARELGRLRKAVDRAQKRREQRLPPEAEGVVPGRGVDEYDYANAVSVLTSKTPAIAMWALQNRINLNKTTLAEALEAVEDFEVESDEPIPQGDIVYEYADGWTMQRLEAADLVMEGELMQHCVGSYCAEVEGEEVAIFSLRDPGGKPHVTVEWRFDWNRVPQPPRGVPIRDQLLRDVGLVDHIKSQELFRGLPKTQIDFEVRDEGTPWEDWEARLADPVDVPISNYGDFVQIMGKQNEPPADKYRSYVQEFIKERFNASPLALLMVWTEAVGTVSFAGHRAEGANFKLIADELAADSDQTFSLLVSFAGGHFVNCRFPHLEGVSFSDAKLRNCAFDDLVDVDFDGVEVWSADFLFVARCIFLHAELRGCRFREIRDCDFRSAHLRSARFSGLVRGCNFNDAIISGLVLESATLIWSSTFVGAIFEMTTLIPKGAGSRIYVALKDVDFSRTRFDAITLREFEKARRENVRWPIAENVE